MKGLYYNISFDEWLKLSQEDQQKVAIARRIYHIAKKCKKEGFPMFSDSEEHLKNLNYISTRKLKLEYKTVYELYSLIPEISKNEVAFDYYDV